MVSQGRANRIAQRIKEELSELLLFETSDPRLSGVHVTDVRVDRELAYANIFFSALEGSERKDEILEGLNHAAGFLRHQLTQRIQLRSFPQIRFNWDPIPENADRIDQLISSLHQDERQDEADDE
jgi:ribosome-binding factor A